jgi:hypothetical protein
MDAMARDLDAAGLAEGRSALVADILSSFWVFGTSEPLDGGAPWYYDGLPGWEDADYFLLPLCPRVPLVRDSMIEEIKARGVTETLTEIRRTPHYILYAKE